MKKAALLLLVFMMLMLGGCSQPGGNSVDRAVSDANIDRSNVYCIQMLDNSRKLVFYQSSGGKELGCALLERGIFGWRCTGNASSVKQRSELERGMMFANVGFKRAFKKQLNISYGMIVNDKIARVEIVMPGGKVKEGKIISVPGGSRLWYAVRDGKTIPDSIKGIAQNGQLLYLYPRKS